MCSSRFKRIQGDWLGIGILGRFEMHLSGEQLKLFYRVHILIIEHAFASVKQLSVIVCVSFFTIIHSWTTGRYRWVSGYEYEDDRFCLQ